MFKRNAKVINFFCKRETKTNKMKKKFEYDEMRQ